MEQRPLKAGSWLDSQDESLPLDPLVLSHLNPVHTLSLA